MGRWVCVHVQLPNCAHTVGHMGVEGERGAGWSWFQVRMAKAVVFGYGPRLTHKTHSTHTHTGQISVWPFKWGWVSRALGQAAAAFYHSFASAVCVRARVSALAGTECVSACHNQQWQSFWNSSDGIWKLENCTVVTKPSGHWVIEQPTGCECVLHIVVVDTSSACTSVLCVGSGW